MPYKMKTALRGHLKKLPPVEPPKEERTLKVFEIEHPETC